MQSWNVNVEREFGAVGLMAGYFGSHGDRQRIPINLNQFTTPGGTVRPFPKLSATSPILPGTTLGNITEQTSLGWSDYGALWVTANRRLSKGLQLAGSYTLSKSTDTNSLSENTIRIQNSFDIAGDLAPSDFDARHRFVVSAIYDLPFTAHAAIRGWQVAAVVQAQSGNPVHIVTSSAILTGVPNAVRPDVTGPVTIVGSVDRWFDPSVFVPVNGFGNLRRNAVVGPGFQNTDLSIVKNTRLGADSGLQLRVGMFDLFNHPNFGPPGNIVGSPTFAKITRTRLPTGEAGSSRQIQLTARVSF
jgi:hypothetical protein